MNSYPHRRALVVGGLGYIGAHLSARLLSMGVGVTVVTPSAQRHAEAAAVLAASGAWIIEGDLRDAEAMRVAVADQDVVFNLAGQSGAVQSADDPFTDLEVNCRGNLVLLEEMRRAAPRTRVVFASSRLAYGETGAEAVAEDRPVTPTCVHAVHKVAVEQYLRVYRRLYGLPFTVARLTNPYGPGQPRERTAYGVVNRMIHLALAGEPITVYGDGRQRRDYIHVDDAVDALVALAAADTTENRLYNVGSGIGTPLVQMAETIAAMTEASVVRAPWPDLAARIETGDFVADIGRIRRDANWAPQIGLREGLERTIAFYRAQVA